MIATAREHGDLKENAEYHAARDKQSFIEGRVKDLEQKLALAEVIDPAKLSGDRVAFGATVKLANTQTSEETTYRIVGADECDLQAGSISITSPLARSLLGKEVGDEVKVRMPGGKRSTGSVARSAGGVTVSAGTWRARRARSFAALTS